MRRFSVYYDQVRKQAISTLSQKVFIWQVDQEQEKQQIINGIISVYSQLRELVWKRRRICHSPCCTDWAKAAFAVWTADWPAQRFDSPTSPGMTGDDDSHLDDYLDADFIIVDEFSMVNTWLALKASQQYLLNTKLLLVWGASAYLCQSVGSWPTAKYHSPNQAGKIAN